MVIITDIVITKQKHNDKISLYNLSSSSGTSLIFSNSGTSLRFSNSRTSLIFLCFLEQYNIVTASTMNPITNINTAIPTTTPTVNPTNGEGVDLAGVVITTFVELDVFTKTVVVGIFLSVVVIVVVETGIESETVTGNIIIRLNDLRKGRYCSKNSREPNLDAFHLLQ